MDEYFLDYLAYSKARAEKHKKRGTYWLTPDGRAELKEAFPDANDSAAVRPLLDRVERLEETLRTVMWAFKGKDRTVREDIAFHAAARALYELEEGTPHPDYSPARGGR